MKITMVNPFFYPFRGGTENYILDLSKYLVGKGHEVDVICSREKGQKKEEKIFGINVHRLNSIILYKLPSLLPPPYAHPIGYSYIGYNLLKKINPDLIHLHSRYFLSYYPLLLHKKKLHKKLLLTIHNSRPEDINWQTNFFGGLFDDIFGNFLMRRTDFIFGNSQYSLNVTIPKDYPKEKTAVAYNGIYVKNWKRKKTNLKDEFGAELLLLTDARLIPQKGIEYLLEAVKKLDADYHLVIKGRFDASGFDYEKKIRKLLASPELKGRVTLKPERLTEEEMVELYSAADIFVLPSLYEPFGIVLIQAMATETPIVATKVGGILEVVGNTALTVPSRDSIALRKAIQKYADDKKLRKQKAKQAYERVKNNFDWKIVGRQVEKVYEKLV